MREYKRKYGICGNTRENTVYGGIQERIRYMREYKRKNLHKFKHNFRDAIDAMCPSNDVIESEEHFLLLCPSFDTQRRSLLGRTLPLIGPLGIANPSNELLTQILLYVRIYLLILIGRYCREPFLSYEKQVALIEIITTRRRISPKIVGPFSTIVS